MTREPPGEMESQKKLKPLLTPISRGFQWVRDQEMSILILMLALVLGFWAFFELANDVREGDTRELDEWVLKSLRNPDNLGDALGPLWVENAVRDLTALGSTIVLILLCTAVTGFLVLLRRYHAAIFLLTAILSALILNNLLKAVIGRARPEVVPHLDHVSTGSFPSGHTLLSSVVYLTLAALAARLTTRTRSRIYIICTALLIVFVVGLSRIYLGVHYPTDVLAGWSVGIAWAIGCWFLARWLQRRGAVEKAEDTGDKFPK